MNQIQLAQQVKTMTSREIAELTEKEHRHVLRDIETMFDQLEIAPEGYAHKWTHPQNKQEYRGYALPEDLTLTLVSGYSAKLRLRIINRWRELEAAAPKAIDLSDPRALRAALLDYSERVIELSAKIEADAPKVEFAEIIRATEAVCHVGEIAKTLGFGRTKFFAKLRADSILMKNNLPYQKYVDKCYFTVIEQEPYTDSKGVTHPTFTTMVTGAGQVFLQRKYGRRKDDYL